MNLIVGQGFTPNIAKYKSPNPKYLIQSESILFIIPVNTN